MGQRNSVQFITVPTVNDTINSLTDAYNPRQVDRDCIIVITYRLLLHHYKFLKEQSSFSVGMRYVNSRTERRQKGLGTTGYDFDLSLISPYKIDLEFKTNNVALFAENVFNLN
ncbi:MAG: hypothetical protein R2784_20450 [Saprospiraceae bacterium]